MSRREGRRGDSSPVKENDSRGGRGRERGEEGEGGGMESVEMVTSLLDRRVSVRKDENSSSSSSLHLHPLPLNLPLPSSSTDVDQLDDAESVFTTSTALTTHTRTLSSSSSSSSPPSSLDTLPLTQSTLPSSLPLFDVTTFILSPPPPHSLLPLDIIPPPLLS